MSWVGEAGDNNKIIEKNEIVNLDKRGKED